MIAQKEYVVTTVTKQRRYTEITIEQARERMSNMQFVCVLSKGDAFPKRHCNNKPLPIGPEYRYFYELSNT